MKVCSRLGIVKRERIGQIDLHAGMTYVLQYQWLRSWIERPLEFWRSEHI